MKTIILTYRKFIIKFRYKISSRFKFLADLRLNLLYLFKKDKSQFGESKLLQQITKINSGKVYYLELGCFQPIVYSNSFSLGSQFIGMHIDANPQLKTQWKLFRNSEVFYNLAVSPEESYSTNYYVFHRRHAVLNTLDLDFAEKWKDHGHNYKIEIVNTISVLAMIILFRKVFNTDIELLIIDVEGLDYEIISKFIEISNENTFNRALYPKWILSEDHDGKVEDLLINLKHSYKIIGKSGPSTLFELDDNFQS